MSIIHMQGKVTTTTYEAICEKSGHNPKDKKCIFIFPGNSSHHRPGTTLFSIKGGAGLALASQNIGRAGYPTLSLPTTSMEQWSTDKQQQDTVQGAIADIYKAIGAGYHIVLPVRPHNNTNYFDEGLFPDGLLEPNFWGGVQTTANKPLANYYINELKNLSLLLSLATDERDKKAQSEKENPFYQAYLQGRAMQADEPCLVPLKHEETARKKAAPDKESRERDEKRTQKSPKKSIDDPLFIPASYAKLYYQGVYPLQGARQLLNDYTKNNSAISRFFHGHWNRHHVAEVSQLVNKIDKGDIQDVTSLIAELKKINLVNTKGSLARRIYFLEEQYVQHNDQELVARM
ncbi:MAG: DUF5617 domain-containing protein [Legionella sp.]